MAHPPCKYAIFRGLCPFNYAHLYSIAQTSDGFLWSVSGDMDTFDGVRFTPWDGPPNGGSITKGSSLWPNSECLCRPRRWALGIWVTRDRSPEGSGGHFSVRVARASDSSKL